MGFTPLFELFTGPLSLHLNPVSALGGVIPAKIQSKVAKADRREPTVWFLRVLLQLAVKEGTISYSILFGM